MPNLFVPGAAKFATSTLHLLLASHPGICMSSPRKEPHRRVEGVRRCHDDRVWLTALFSDSVSRLRQVNGTEFEEWADDFPFTSSPAPDRSTPAS